jgi:hypothetical protein
MDLGPGGTRSPGPSGFGGGYNATTSSNTGGGSGGDNQPIVARPDYVVTDSVPNYPRQGIFSKLFNQLSPYVVGYAGAVLGGPFAGKKFYDITKEEAEKRQQAEDLVPSAMLSGSQVFSIPGSFQQAYNKQYGIPNTTTTIPTFTGGDNEPIIPMQQMQVAETPTDVNGTISDFDLYMQNLRAAQPNPFMLDPRFAAAEGGEVRQAYGLGSLVRKITRPIKKILKSDVGKAALLYGLGTYLGGTTAFGGSGKSSFFQRFKDPKLLKNLRSPQFLTSGETTSALSTVTPTTGADAVIAPFGRLNLEAATAAAEAVKPTPTLIDKAVTYAIEKPVPTIFGLSSLAALSAAGEEDESLDGITSREDDSGLKELIARYPELRFQVQKPYQLAANGGRMGYEEGGNINPADLPMSREGLPTYEDIETGEEVEYPYKNKEMSSAPDIDAELFQMYLDAIGSGKIPRSTTFDQYKELMGETASMSPKRTMANEGGLMSLGGNEMDLRGGGFVPLGAREKADDVPARLSKNEFVFTADAVKAAGGGDVDRGADLMYKTMKNLESRVG